MLIAEAPGPAPSPAPAGTAATKGDTGSKQPQSPGSVDWLLPIDQQLRYLRQKDVQHAYDQTTSTDFKKATTPEEFAKFVKGYPILFTHTDISVQTQAIGNNEANIIVTLNPDKEAVPVNYLLRKESGNWKVWSMNVTSPYSSTVSELLQNPNSMRTVVEAQLQALRANDILKAYYDHTSQEFQHSTSLDDFRKFVSIYPSITQYDAIQFKDPVISKTTGHLELNIQSKLGDINLDYTLGFENDEWKIWGIQVLKSTPQTVLTQAIEGSPTNLSPNGQAPTGSPSMRLDRPTQTSIPSSPTSNQPTSTPTLSRPVTSLPTVATTGSSGPPQPQGQTGAKKENLPIVFSKAEVGTILNAKGEIENPAIVLRSPQGAIYVNIYVRNGIAKTKINVTLEHLDSRSILPEVSTTLEQDGELILSFAFAAPTKGWPVGNYLIQVNSSTGVQRQYSFIIQK